MSLPPLADLRLDDITAGNNDAEAGASDAYNYDSDVEHEYERLDQRAHRKFPKLMPAPEVTKLTGMPREVVGLIVEQAAMAARPAGGIVSEETATAALGMCQWMRSFCRAAKVQELPCDDDWFRLALGAFSDFVPKDNTLPMGCGFRTWKDLFWELCKALHPVGDYPIAASFEARDFLLYANGQQHTLTWMWNFGTGASQRQLDTLLRALIQTKVQQWPSIVTKRKSDDKYLQERAAVQAQLRQIQNALDQIATTPPANAPYGLEKSDWMAFVTMLLMRGANPHGWEHWNDLDVQLYVAIMQDMTNEVPWDEAGEGRVRQLLKDGANPSYGGLTVSAAGYDAPPIFTGSRAYPHVLVLAVRASNFFLLKTLLDAGATVGPLADIFELLKALAVYTLRPEWSSNERFPLNVITTHRLLFQLLIPKLIKIEDATLKLNMINIITSTYNMTAVDEEPVGPAWVHETWLTMMQWVDPDFWQG
ncbi:MAG: hypothetical protein CMD92_07085 [Gammaproteobacteria bacterium]|nr:hypothetical protein [Gammaproteobacteria bacterium]|tara:strand:- start:2732 stop:4165 length:1434 start_codon:yes stop_codon:yes gene_type:complete